MTTPEAPTPGETDPVTGEVEGRESVFWGPIGSESKAQRIIDWTVRIHLTLAGIVLASVIRSLFMNGFDGELLIENAFIILPLGVPALWLMQKRSRIAAALLVAVCTIGLVLAILLMADSVEQGDAGMLYPVLALIMLALGWLSIRAFRAAGVWQRVRRQTRKVSEMFD